MRYGHGGTDAAASGSPWSTWSQESRLMSMYTELLAAACGQEGPAAAGATERDALEEVLRCRAWLGEPAPTSAGVDRVPIALARELSYDVALLRLALLVGVETHPDRFDQPRRERARLEGTLRARGINLEAASHNVGPWPIPS